MTNHSSLNCSDLVRSNKEILKNIFSTQRKNILSLPQNNNVFQTKKFQRNFHPKRKGFFLFFLHLLEKKTFFQTKIVFFIITRKNNFPNKEFLILKVFYFYPILIIVSETFFSLCNIFLYLISLCFSSSVRVLYHSCPYYLFFSFSSLEKLCYFQKPFL